MAFSEWNPNDYAAWWGAIIATLALLWNIILALKKGPRVSVKATPNMQIIPESPETADKLYISVTAVNKGSSPTTITHFCGYHTKNFWGVLFNKYRQNFVINTMPSTGNVTSYVLKPGEQWSNLADQSELNKKRYTYIGIIHTHKKKPVYVRVKFNA